MNLFDQVVVDQSIPYVDGGSSSYSKSMKVHGLGLIYSVMGAIQIWSKDFIIFFVDYDCHITSPQAQEFQSLERFRLVWG
jgi:hypothetical protein